MQLTKKEKHFLREKYLLVITSKYFVYQYAPVLPKYKLSEIKQLTEAKWSTSSIKCTLILKDIDEAKYQFNPDVDNENPNSFSLRTENSLFTLLSPIGWISGVLSVARMVPLSISTKYTSPMGIRFIVVASLLFNPIKYGDGAHT